MSQIGALIAAMVAVLSSTVTAMPTEDGGDSGQLVQRPLHVCRIDPESGELRVELAAERAGDRIRLLRSAPGSWTRLDLAAEAEGATWYRNGDPVRFDGADHVPTGSPWSPGGAVNRYLRRAGDYRGVPTFDLWPQGGRPTLVVLVTQVGCVFRTYRRLDEPQR